MFKINPVRAIIFLTVLIGCEPSNHKYTDLNKENLKGKIKTRRIFSYPFQEKFIGVSDPNTYYGDKVYYNADGFKTESESFDSNGKISSKTKYVYDRNGNQINEIKYKLSNGNLEMKKLNYIFDKGNKIEWNDYSVNGSFIGKTSYIYDDRGNLIENIRFDSTGTRAMSERYSYNDKHRPVDYSYYNKEGKLGTHKKYFYDKKGNRIGENIYQDGVLYSENSTEYLLFDNNGNWIKCIHYKNGQPQNVVEREVEYF